MEIYKLPFSSKEENEKFKELYNNNFTRDINQISNSSNPKLIRFLENFCAALMIELNKKFPEPNYSFYMTYRIKSAKSSLDKLEKYLKRVNIDDNSISTKKFNDLIGIRLIIEKIPRFTPLNKTMPNYDKFLELKKERDHNISLSEKFHEYATIIKNDECTKYDYYKYSKEVIESISNMLVDKEHPKYANDLKETYSYLSDICEKNINMLEIIGDFTSKIHPESSKIDFIQLLNDFDSRIDSKMSLQLYSSYIEDIIPKSERLKALGCSVSKNNNRTKQKREESGFFANFKGINFEGIPLNFELQIMPINEHLSSVLGYSAHSNMPNKNPNRCELPIAFLNKHLKTVNNTDNLTVLNMETVNILRHVSKIKDLSNEDKLFIKTLLDNISKDDLNKSIPINEYNQHKLREILKLNTTEFKNLTDSLYNEGITNFNCWAENISATHATLRLDKESSAKSRVKISYDNPYERLAHVLRQQVEGYNIDSSEAELVEQYLSLIYEHQNEWFLSSQKTSSATMGFEIDNYIKNDLPTLKKEFEDKQNDIER